MRIFSKLISSIFNPIFIPLAGVLLYFFISPKYNNPEVKRLILLSVFIVTVIIPFIFFLLLKHLGWITNNEITDVKERRIPLYICIILTYITLIKIISTSHSIELYFYFLGILGTLMSCLAMVYFNFKVSMHMMGISGLTTFVSGLSFHYEINTIFILAFLILCIGSLATARLYLKLHNPSQLIVGILIGSLPQFIMFYYWL